MSKAAVVAQSQSPEFQAIVGQHFLEAAVAIMAEAANTANHAERVLFAKVVLSGGLNTGLAARVVATNATVSANLESGKSTWTGQDSDISFVVASVWNALAGVGT